jgi:RNA polymerase sigma-70 factor, ECF subfamily
MSNVSGLSDEALMELIKKGNEHAFGELYNRYSKKALAFFYRMFNNDEEKAQDALQDIFMKVVERPELFDTDKKFSSWFFSVAWNMCKNEYKHASIKNNVHAAIRSTESRYDDSFFPKISGKIDGAAFRETLTATLEALPPDKRSAFLLKYQENRSIKEIAEIQSCSEGTVKSRLFYTVKQLAAKLAVFDPKY